MSVLDVTIEIPAGGRNKYEIDHASGRIRLDRTLFTPMVYPADYGYIEGTLGLDGDPLDALVLLAEPAFPGVLVAVRPVGVFQMADEHGDDAKVISVPATDPRWDRVQDIDDVPAEVKASIGHFFARYKDLEPGKFVTVHGFDDRDAAEKIIADAVRAARRHDVYES
jgi:inorganic pyrophosphatase